MSFLETSAEVEKSSHSLNGFHRKSGILIISESAAGTFKSHRHEEKKLVTERPTPGDVILVGGIPTPLKNMSSSVGMMTFPYGK